MPRKKSNTAQEDEAPSVASKNSASTSADADNKKKDNRSMSDAPSILQFSEDISNAEPPVPLPVGEYPAEIRGAEVKTSQKGNRYVSVKFFVNPDSYPVDYQEGNPDGEILTYNRLVYDDSPRGRHRMRKFTESIGAKGGNEIDVNDWAGLTATLAVTEEEFEGEKRAVISKVTAA